MAFSSSCPRGVWNHIGGCTCPAFTPAAQDASTSAFGTYDSPSPAKSQMFPGYGFDAEINDTEWQWIPDALYEELVDDQPVLTPVKVEGEGAVLTKLADSDGYKIAMRPTDLGHIEAKFVKVSETELRIERGKRFAAARTELVIDADVEPLDVAVFEEMGESVVSRSDQRRLLEHARFVVSDPDDVYQTNYLAIVPMSDGRHLVMDATGAPSEGISQVTESAVVTSMHDSAEDAEALLESRSAVDLADFDFD